jgi:hypothetical protein
MATAGPLNHTSFTMVAGGGATTTWTNPAQAIADDDIYSEAGTGDTDESERIRGTAALNFNVGTPASVAGLQVSYKARKVAGGDDYTLNINLYNGTNTTVLATKSVTINTEKTAWQSGTVGGAADTWSGAVTVARANTLRVGYSIQTPVIAAGSEAEVDWIGGATLTYTAAGGTTVRGQTRNVRAKRALVTRRL